ncbi:MAG TPA: PQQ-binding-like beta-propeller repeat protein, partial [Candidatus Nanoarchaeia archaeon]|nr:PQQ-binding-like beta-propeller repeat protein [Candidatus Nanoarchaeia archaeon]
SMVLPVDPNAGTFAISLKELRTWYFYDLNTGNLLKGPTDPQASMDMYGANGAVAYGKLFSYGYGGIVYAYDMKSGTLLWSTPLGTAGLEGPYQYWPVGSGAGVAIADHKIYLTTYEHSTTEPLYRAWSIFCMDTETGKMLWNITALAGAPIIADGYMVLLNSMDNQIYCFGKGETATTVSTQTFAAPQGTPVLIQGTVTDQSPGAAGSPAISDVYMKEWMQHEYMQQATPTNAVGVPVHLTAIDPNGNFQDIGNVTSDITGNYRSPWTPPVPGVYAITATFAGSDSYFASSSETGLLVVPAPSAAAVVTPTPAPTQPTVTATPGQPTNAPTIAPTPSPAVIPPTSAAPTATYIAMGAIALIIVAAIAALILRKRK